MKRTLREQKEMSHLLSRAKHMLEECNMTARAVAKRLHIKYSRLLKIRNQQIDDPYRAFARYKPRPRFKKLHSRARDVVADLLINSTKPLQVPDIVKEIKKRTQLNINNTTVRLYMREHLDVSYRKLRPVS